jgi:hypothetical protein
MTSLREIKLLKELRSPYIVSLLDVFPHKRKLTMVRRCRGRAALRTAMVSTAAPGAQGACRACGLTKRKLAMAGAAPAARRACSGELLLSAPTPPHTPTPLPPGSLAPWPPGPLAPCPLPPPSPRCLSSWTLTWRP